ncbi:MAG: efflux RND transporter permease subunit [Planctomycetaceae bacterium]
MISSFYQAHSKSIICLVILSFPVLFYIGAGITSNNDIETWLPRNTPERAVYEQFKDDFGMDESIIIGIDTTDVDARLVEAFAGRIDQTFGIRSCWTPDRLRSRMHEFGVADASSHERLNGMLLSSSGKMIGLVATLTPEGIAQRGRVVAGVQEAIQYCQLSPEQVALTGEPVIVTELDRLGGKTSNNKFFTLTLLISLSLLYYFVGHWGMSLSLLGITIWGISLTQACMALFGAEMNFIMGALSVMVMIFTLSVSIHFLGYYSSAVEENDPNPLSRALKESFNPCVLSTVTTLIGLMSLNASNILPVSQFGYAAALGSVVAFIVGLGITPALCVVWPKCTVRIDRRVWNPVFWSDWVNDHKRVLLAAAGILLCVAMYGVAQLRSHIDPVDFLPHDNWALKDLRRIEHDLTSIDSIEAVVDFQQAELPFVDRLQHVRAVQEQFEKHRCVRHVFSLATFFPEVLPENTLEVMQLLNLAQSYQQEQNYTAWNHDLWRICIRMDRRDGTSQEQIRRELTQLAGTSTVYFTGLGPILEGAQVDIFNGFWKSLTTAFLMITAVMIISLRSFTAGLIAMVPNVIPIILVFGVVGYCGLSVDIGMMMTGSIALGISVDCTFHFLVSYQEHYRAGKSSIESSKLALQHTGAPMLDSTIIASFGMLALCLSQFTPTVRFGYLMSAQMLASMLGELMILPALLCLRSGRKKRVEVASAESLSRPLFAPHFLWRGRRKSVAADAGLQESLVGS